MTGSTEKQPRPRESDASASGEDVRAQVRVFRESGLTTQYRESQYPPFLVVEKMKKKYTEAVEALLTPMKLWISRKDLPSPSKLEGRVRPSVPAGSR